MFAYCPCCSEILSFNNDDLEREGGVLDCPFCDDRFIPEDAE